MYDLYNMYEKIAKKTHKKLQHSLFYGSFIVLGKIFLYIRHTGKFTVYMYIR